VQHKRKIRAPILAILQGSRGVIVNAVQRKKDQNPLVTKRVGGVDEGLQIQEEKKKSFGNCDYRKGEGEERRRTPGRVYRNISEREEKTP